MARHTPDKAQRDAVTVMIGLGAPHQVIADGLNIELETFQRVYEQEIANGPALVKLEAMKQLFNAAKTADGAGRTTAAVKLIDMLQSDDQASSDANTIRITGKDVTAYFSDYPHPPMELFTREGAKVSWVFTTGDKDGV
jgi:hypothetical protein